MLLELAALLVCLVVTWYVQFRPRSSFNVRPPYRVLEQAPTSEARPATHFDSFDYVVVGGGPGGLAAARALLEQTEGTGESILLVERGRESLPDSQWQAYLRCATRGRLLAFAPDMVFLPQSSGVVPGKLGPTLAGEPVEDGSVAHRPFRFPIANEEEEEVEAKDSTQGTSAPTTPKNVKMRVVDTLLSYTTYPQGKGIGGTSQLDWGMHLPSILPTEGEGDEEDNAIGTDEPAPRRRRRKWWVLPVSLTKVRNPLSWAFTEAAATDMVKERYMPTTRQPCKRYAVYPAFLRVDVDGRRLPVASALLGDVPVGQLGRLSVLVNHTALSLNCGGSGAGRAVVESVTCVSTTGEARCTIKVRRGVVVSAGVVATPRLLRSLAPSALPPLRSTTRVRDVVALPMVFRAHAGVSADAKNMQDTKGTALWYLSQRGPYLQPIADTIASVPVPELGPAAEMRFLLLPFGGKDPRRFYQMGWDRILASFDDGVTILMMLTGADGLTHPLELETEHGSAAVGTRSVLKQRHLRPLAVVEDLVAATEVNSNSNNNSSACGEEEGGNGAWELDPQVQAKVVAAFVKAMQACRSVTAVAPLNHLVPSRGGPVKGLAGEEAMDYSLMKEDPAQAVRLAKLMHTPPTKRSGKMKRELVKLLEWAYACVNTEAYMRLYVAQHAYWLGFGSGSSEPFLSSAEPFFVHGLANTVVGDNSAVTDAMWSAGGKDTLAAGSVSSAIVAGRQAALALWKREGQHQQGTAPAS